VLWKAPVQRDFVAGVQAALAEAFNEDATYETVIDALREPCGPLPTKLIDRAVTIAREADDHDELVEEMYERALFPEYNSLKDAPQEVDADLPPSHDPVPYTAERYAAFYNHEQIPLAVAGFVFSEGHPEDSITNTVMLGRDADSTATSVGSGVGALHGESAFPEEWVDTVCEVNKGDIDIRDLSERLIESEL
jgi:ADP-ribosylglycohydrolase